MNTDHQRIQKEMKSKSQTVRVYRMKGTYETASGGLIGREQETLKSMFTEDGKQPLQFHKLSSIQKKVLRKMGYPKEIFIIPK